MLRRLFEPLSKTSYRARPQCHAEDKSESKSERRARQVFSARRAWWIVLLVGVLWSCGGRAGLLDSGPVKVAGSGGGATATSSSSSSSGGGNGMGGAEPLSLNKVDLLLVVDNSRGMSRKAAYLQNAVDDLVGELMRPPCVDDKGRRGEQPEDPDASCPAGTKRAFAPVRDLHIGIVSSSLGGNGADTCTEFFEDQKAQLLAKTDMNQKVESYKGLGFLAWDPDQLKQPSGETDSELVRERLGVMLKGIGTKGCGFEATHEAWYRFLIEPAPYEEIEVVNSQGRLIGLDKKLLQQRREFLRPDSLLIIVPLSDENDCSMRAGGQYYIAMQRLVPGTNQPFHLPAARAACAENPNSPCCRSCAQEPGPGCDTSKDKCDPINPLEDNINVRCWQQKRRFGIDFRYPIDRYLEGLQSPQVMDSEGEVRNNPLFVDLKEPSSQPNKDLGGRRVLYSPIVGVPWQDLARRNANGAPDLEAGLDGQGNPRGLFQSAAELKANGSWGLILGDPQRYHLPEGLPRDPFMIESIEPRSGTHPVTGDAIADTGATPGASAINGHETAYAQRDELQTACLTDLTAPAPCNDSGGLCCGDVTDAACQNPDTNQFTPSVQYAYRARPGVRHLELAEKLGTNTAVGSICGAPESDLDSPAYGLRPSTRSIIDAAADFLRQQ